MAKRNIPEALCENQGRRRGLTTDWLGLRLGFSRDSDDIAKREIYSILAAHHLL
jgi:hypothetical protein